MFPQFNLKVVQTVFKKPQGLLRDKIIAAFLGTLLKNGISLI